MIAMIAANPMTAPMTNAPSPARPPAELPNRNGTNNKILIVILLLV